LLGMWFMWLTLPSVLEYFSELLSEGYRILGSILRL